jgi:maltooligosyltrehalose trehalohydrolase
MRVQAQTMPRQRARKREQTVQSPPLPLLRRFPIGAEVAPQGGTHFRVWAPKSKTVAVEVCQDARFEPNVIQSFELEREEHGYFSGYAQPAAPGRFYKLRLEEGAFPDPASRFQPEGPHGPSQIVDPARFRWTDEAWRGVPRPGQVIYEMHLGTFTREGTWRAAQAQLPELARLGITVLELMPVAEFPGRFGWGYDGVDLFAPTHLYGEPDDFRAFVDAAHHLGLGIILDVVYNHFGPDGNYLKHFSEDYFSKRHQCEWGEAINFDGEGSGPVREFFITNAAYWVDEFHVDGLRLDATQQIFDESPNHIIGVLSRKVHETAPDRATYLVAENECQHSHLARPFEEEGYGLDALWNDDFHHSARVALTGRSEAYYSDYQGTPQEFISAMKWGYLYQGQWYSWQKKRRGTPSRGLTPEQFITFLQNHDQVANSLRGQRLGALTSPGRLRAMTALLLLGPATPMLFQGQEFGASAPFAYFADHHPELARLVAKGRGEFLRQFESVACPECDAYVSDAGAEETFLQSKLDLSEREQHSEIYRMHRDLLKLRREDPVFSHPRTGGVDGAVLGPHAFVLRFFGCKAEDRLLLVNLGVDLKFQPLPEPLLAPMEGGHWKLKWSSENPRYGGCGTPAIEKEGVWRMPGHAAVVLGP